jgi:hypothetical protein
LKEEHRLRVVDNRVLRRIFGHERDEVRGGWSKLHNEELHNLYSTPYRILVGKAEGKTLLGSHRRRWEDNTKLDNRETGWGGMDWIGLAQDRDQWRALVNMVHLRVP